MQSNPVYFHVAALIWAHGRGAPHGDLLLVQQKGPEDGQSHWALPGGRVAAGELLMDGLSRAVRETTGVQIVHVGELVYTARVDNPHHGFQSHARVFAVQAWQGRVLPADPGQSVLDVAFFPLARALELLSTIPSPAVREPLLAYLEGEVTAGDVWLYHQEGDAPPQLITRRHGPASA